MTRTLDQIRQSLTEADGLEFADHAVKVLARLNIPKCYQFQAGSMGYSQAIAVRRDSDGRAVEALIWDGYTEVGPPWKVVPIDDEQAANHYGIGDYIREARQ